MRRRGRHLRRASRGICFGRRKSTTCFEFVEKCLQHAADAEPLSSGCDWLDHCAPRAQVVEPRVWDVEERASCGRGCYCCKLVNGVQLLEEDCEEEDAASMEEEVQAAENFGDAAGISVTSEKDVNCTGF